MHRSKTYFGRDRRSEPFTCIHCKQFIPVNDTMGTAHRNHCNLCLWSKHVDEELPGDRKSACGGAMKPIGLTMKSKDGELMLLHVCEVCNKLSKNRIAADDNEYEILQTFENSQKEFDNLISNYPVKDILCTKEDEPEIRTQLFGR